MPIFLHDMERVVEARLEAQATAESVARAKIAAAAERAEVVEGEFRAAFERDDVAMMTLIDLASNFGFDFLYGKMRHLSAMYGRAL